MAAARAIVTRPAREAAHWVHQLQDRGIRAESLPLIEIQAVADPALRARLAQARAQADRFRALMFVSPNAVQHFFGGQPLPAALRAALEGGGTRAWAPGPGTVRALLQAGVPAGAIDAPPADSPQFESEALWPMVAPRLRPGDRVLVVRGASSAHAAAVGGHGRPWLGQQLQAAGAEVEFVAAYARARPVLDAAGRRLAEAAAADGSIWLFSSSEALGHLQALLPGQSWRQARAVATHPRIATAAHAAGFGRVRQSRPCASEVAASIESFDHVD